jgi:CxxC-x17-CxxC domain-containing protein
MVKNTGSFRTVCSECNIEFKIFAKNDENENVYCEECYAKASI